MNRPINGPTPSKGAGSAKLSYVLLQKLLKLSTYLPRSGSNNGEGNSGAGVGFCFKYVITDFSHANFGFWMNHPRLQELFALGVVDFAVFDAEAGPGEVGGVDPSSRANEDNGDDGSDGGEVAAENGAGPAANTEGSSRNSSSGSGEEGPRAKPGAELWGSGCLRLELSGEELRPGDLDNPVIVVANYVFDSLKQDAFR